MLNYQDLIEQGKQAGFTHVAPLKVSTIQLMSEVRDMCATNSCGAYGKKWSCEKIWAGFVINCRTMHKLCWAI